ncbi:MAG: UDP-N-acetylmuramoyl-L-alanine--D-glutamate ligase [Chloroflexi bacterium]|nr:UDP-N-acetylmuramoyl-L-alanine--D-glutamate ligase [Chloroflexota bacterium]
MSEFSAQNILVVGLAREGKAVCRWLSLQGADVVASDVRSAQTLSEALHELSAYPIQFRLGPQTPEHLTGIDGIIVSPGVPQDIPLLQEAQRRAIPISTETRLFARRSPAAITAITGSSGKTTTATLTARMIAASDYHTWLGGNIGAPLLEELPHIQPEHRVVMELSSFQLLYWGQTPAATARPWHRPQGLSPHIAALLNVTPNHLDRHPSMAHYTAAKANILAWQNADDIAVLNLDDPLLARWANEKKGRVQAGAGQEAWQFPLAAHLLTFSLERPPPGDGAWLDHDRITLRWQGSDLPLAGVDEVRLRGRHNLANILAAVCLSAAAGANPAAQRDLIRSFDGVEHRLEEVRRLDDVLWINDSIATSPERAIAAMRSFDAPLILLAGGRDKHLPWEQWATLVHQRVRHLITFGEAAPLITAAVQPLPPGSQLHIHQAPDLPAAVARAAHLAQPGNIVLLSPGGTSFDAYPDFAARGQHFRTLVQAL